MLVLVGATIVGSMATVWHGVVNPPRGGEVREWRYDDRQIVLDKGEEMGRFLLGSTVVMLFPHRRWPSIPHGRRRARCGWAKRMAELPGRTEVVDPAARIPLVDTAIKLVAERPSGL